MSVINVQFGNPSPRLALLRELLAEKFPEAPLNPGGVLPIGQPAFDGVDGGLRRGAVTELAGSPGSGGLFIEAMLSTLQRRQYYAALVDAGSGFDPQGCDPTALRRLLWIMCSDVKQSIRAADLLLRDANLPLVLLDLQLVAPRQLRGIPASTWHRFQRLVEQTSTAFVVLSPRPMVEAAQMRIMINNQWGLDAMRKRRGNLIGQIEARVFPRREFSVLPEARCKTA
jgi:hypothetical protein